MQLFGLRKTPDLSLAPRQALAAFEHDGLRSSDGRLVSNRPFAHSGKFCGQRARRKPLKPLRGESRVISGATVVTTVCLLPMHTGYGCSGHPAFPAPSSIEGQCSMQKLGQIVPREGEDARIEHQCPSQTARHRQRMRVHPVFQRRRCWKREAAAYWIPAFAGYDGLMFCWRASSEAERRAMTTGEWLFENSLNRPRRPAAARTNERCRVW